MGLFDKKNSSNTHITKAKQVLEAAIPGMEWLEDGPGNWGNRNGSIMVRVVVDTDTLPEHPMVAVVAFVLLEARNDDALFRYLLTDVTFPMNQWEVEPGDKKGAVNVYLVRRLLIADLDPTELEFAVMSTALIADDLDEDLQKRFGGQRCLEIFGWEE
jgi:hypothetical protein